MYDSRRKDSVVYALRSLPLDEEWMDEIHWMF